MRAKTSTHPNETHALTLTTQTYEDMQMHLKVKTNKQLRQNSTPNPWEVLGLSGVIKMIGTIIILSSNLMELNLARSKMRIRQKSRYSCILQMNPKLKIDEWNTWYIKMSGNHIEIWLKMADGSMQRIVDYHDNAPIVGPGNIGLYTETHMCNLMMSTQLH